MCALKKNVKKFNGIKSRKCCTVQIKTIRTHKAASKIFMENVSYSLFLRCIQPISVDLHLNISKLDRVFYLPFGRYSLGNIHSFARKNLKNIMFLVSVA